LKLKTLLPGKTKRPAACGLKVGPQVFSENLYLDLEVTNELLEEGICVVIVFPKPMHVDMLRRSHVEIVLGTVIDVEHQLVVTVLCGNCDDLDCTFPVYLVIIAGFDQ
jgi:hypothetical protein